MQRSLVVAWNKLRALVQRSAREADMDEEMRLHVEMEAADLRQAGVPADEALRRARAAFGGIERQKDDARDAVGVRLLDDLAQDFRYGARQLRASPAFTAATLLTLALGVGATTTMYTIEHTVATFGVDIADPGRLVHVAQGTIGGCLSCWRIAKGNYMTLRDESRTLSDVTLIAGWNPILRGSERTEIVNGARVTPAFFELLGIHAMLGRTVVRADSTTDRENVVVVSESFWQTKLGRRQRDHRKDDRARRSAADGNRRRRAAIRLPARRARLDAAHSQSRRRRRSLVDQRQRDRSPAPRRDTRAGALRARDDWRASRRELPRGNA